jgi:type I restriction enzyme R subunit
MLLDTYTTFGCEDGKPTFQYSLLHGVKDGFLVNPCVVDARTEITTQLLSDEGYTVEITDDNGEETSTTFSQRDFEKKLFSENTNRIFCKTFLENAYRDPISGEIGKSIVFCVSQNHAAKITQILNEFADKMFPGKYQSDFAMQVTSWIPDAQQLTINFTNNRLGGKGNFHDLYRTSKTRVCVTVGMMTTGYDCPDILNVCLMRPIFSPTDFIQIKGRGTRKFNFANKEVLKDKGLIENIPAESLQKSRFKLFDFFANCEFFEEKFNYDEVLKLPPKGTSTEGGGGGGYVIDEYDSTRHDPLKTFTVNEVGVEGMKIDRMYFEKFEDKVKEDDKIKELVQQKNFDAIEQYIISQIFDKPEEYYNISKLRNAIKIDRRLSLREIIEKIFGFIPYFKSKDELLDEEFEKFDSRYLPPEEYFMFAMDYFKSYITDSEFREIIEKKKYALLNTNPNGDVFRKLPPELRFAIPEYIKDNVSLNKFVA